MIGLSLKRFLTFGALSRPLKNLPPRGTIATTNLHNIFTDRHLSEYQQNGATLVENVLTSEEVDGLIKATEDIVKARDIFKKIVIFKSGDHKRGLEFLETGDKTHFFFEPGVFDENNKLLVDQSIALNKIGHAMHDLEPYYIKFCHQQLYKYILKQIGYIAPNLVQTMYIYKNPKVGTQVQAHTDNTYLITKPKQTCIGFWIALHDATVENGCLWGISGSQKDETTRWMLRNATNDDVVYEGIEKDYDVSKAIPLEVKKGSMLVFHGDYVHYSQHNTSHLPRHALTMHFVETQGVKWIDRNWLQRNEKLPFKDYYKFVDSQTA